MEDLYVVIANYGQGQQTVHPRTRDSRGTGAPIFGDPDGSGGITGLYTKAEADAIVKDGNRDKGFGSPHYHAKPLSVAHEYAQGLSGNLIRQVQSEIGVMGESAAIKEAPYGSYGLRQIDYNEGDTIEYKNNAGKFVTVVVDYKDDDIKRGEPGFEGTTDTGRQVWGYDNQVVRVKRSASVRESKTVRIKKRTLKRMIRERLRGVEVYDGPNPPEAFPIRVGWDGGSFDASNPDELEMITRDLVSKGIAYSVDSVSDLEDEIAVGAGIEQYAESTGKIRIKKSELRKIIREIRDVPADVVDIDNGEVHAEDIFPADFAIWLRNNPEFREASADEIRSMQPGYDGDFRVRRRAMSEAPVDIPAVVSDQVTAANQEIQSLLQQIDVEEDPAEIGKINDRIKDLKAAVGELEKTAVEATGDTQVEGVLRAGLLRGIIAEAMTELENLEPVDYPHAYDEDAMTADLEASGFNQWSRDLARELGYNDPNEMPADMLSQELGMPYDAWKAGVAAKSYAKTI